MLLLHEVDKPGSDVEEYVSSLDAILKHKLDIIQVVRNKLNNFKEYLRQEKELSSQFNKEQSSDP